MSCNITLKWYKVQTKLGLLWGHKSISWKKNTVCFPLEKHLDMYMLKHKYKMHFTAFVYKKNPGQSKYLSL